MAIFIALMLLLVLLFGYTDSGPPAQFVEKNQFGFLLATMCLLLVSLWQTFDEWLDRRH